ncbi:26S proteasome non-ATPase regulatory subunit 5 [Entomortierella parvispora]|uniref:26S proteasome non-ATPase regulatory subunit 5 n=1 Tax=Entomortierella parvispora TaxID=205924 RepID=A0A9P3HIN4_9FUNG|nr:26S proteasome non-ATPase regulatory subunit 5 [Entomortierella parvispora]
MPTVDNSTEDNAQLQHSITTFAAGLQDSLAVHDALTVFDHALKGVHGTEAAQQILSSVPLTQFFQLLQADHGDETEITIDKTCGVLELLLKDQSYSSAAQDPFMAAALMQALNSPSERVYALGLSQVNKVADENTATLRAMLESDVFKAVIDGIASSSISVADRAKQTLLKICHTQDKLEIVLNYDGSFCAIRDLVNSKSSIVQMRMMEVLTKLAAQSREAMTAIQKVELLDPLESGVTTTDFLARFNIIEILAEFGVSESGSEYLDESGILARLSEVVATEASEDSLSVSAILKLYGKLGDSKAVGFVSLDMKYQILSQLQGLLDARDDDVELDESLKVEAMAAIGLIGGNLQNVEWLAQSSCVTSFLRQYATLSRETRVAWYHSLAQILASSTEPTPAEDGVILGMYSKLEGPSQSPFLARLLTSAKSQSPELSMAALSAMIPLSRYPFAVQNMGALRDFITFLLDRTATLSHSEKVAKHEVIEGMLKTYERVKTNSGNELLTVDQVSRLDLNRRQGPFYQRATATVSILDQAA